MDIQTLSNTEKRLFESARRLGDSEELAYLFATIRTRDDREADRARGTRTYVIEMQAPKVEAEDVTLREAFVRMGDSPELAELAARSSRR